MIANARDIIDRADIAQVVGSYVPLRPLRNDREYDLTGDCPWHRPSPGSTSFRVSTSTGRWWCWGCYHGGGGALHGGNAIAFLARWHNLDASRDFPALVELLAAQTGQQIVEDGPRQAAGPSRADLHAVLGRAADLYAAALAASPEALAYLDKRGFDAAFRATYRLGLSSDYRPAGLLELAPRPVLVAAGLLCEPDDSRPGGEPFDPLHHRVVLPFHDAAGRVVGFVGRAMAAELTPKYRNTADTALYRKGEHLFNLHRVFRSSRLHIMEGQLKAAAATEAGYPAVAPGGAALTPPQCAQLLRSGAELLVCPDPDAAGAAAAIHHLSTLRAAGTTPRVGILRPADEGPALKDADDYRAKGRPFRVDALEWIPWACALVDAPQWSDAWARHLSETVLPIALAAVDPIQAEADLARLADHVGLSPSVLRAAALRRPPARAAAEAPCAPSQTMTTARLLACMALQWPLPPGHAGEPNPWQALCRWTAYPAPLVAALAEIARVRDFALRCGMPVAQAVEASPPADPALAAQFRLWAAMPLPAAADPATLARVDARLVEKTAHQWRTRP
jgi:DNA primase catalytic core